jgi:hypothetical protein
MITEIFPKGFQRYQLLPVLGPLMDRYAEWLRQQQYTWRSTRYELRMAAQVAEYLKRRAVRRIDELQQRHLDACYHRSCQRFPGEASSVLVLERFLIECGRVEKRLPSPLCSPVGLHVRHLWLISRTPVGLHLPRFAVKAKLPPSFSHSCMLRMYQTDFLRLRPEILKDSFGT